MKTKPCTMGARHKWTWVKNITIRRFVGRSIHISLRGSYVCECGAKKVGESNHNAPSPLTDMVDTSKSAKGGD